MSHTIVQDLIDFFQSLTPSELAEDWDNTGLLVGERGKKVKRIMTCLTVTPTSVEEAIDNAVDIIVTHHPLPFHALKRITDESISGSLLLRLIGNGIAVFSPHTAYDSAKNGINQQLADSLGLTDVRPLNESDSLGPTLGSGRFGSLPSPTPLSELLNTIKSQLQVTHLQVVGDLNHEALRVAIACGSGGSFLAAARERGCDTFLTGETSFHSCLDAESAEISLILTGHYASERAGVQWLAQHLGTAFPDLEVWASCQESDPIQLV